jgi:hypothetical protein
MPRGAAVRDGVRTGDIVNTRSDTSLTLFGGQGAEHGWFHALANPRSVNDETRTG